MEDHEEKEIKSIGRQLSEFLRERFNLDEDKAEQDEVVENVRRGVEFRGTNLWVLIFAIVVASVGLNVNSTAVIIGAMLISPLMGPIMGLGLSVGIYDFELLKRSAKNFGFAVLVSLVVSTFYFMISPLDTAQSELLARTTPTIWDVLIAAFGGLAGIVAQSRKDRTSTVIPGVAIATALMPPLCTAGFGLATGNWAYFGGAFYLFLINTVFIAFATYFIVRFLKYRRKQHLDPVRAKKVKRYMAVILTATLVPSVVLAYGLVQRTVFETTAHRFVAEELQFDRSEVVGSTITYSRGALPSTIEAVVVGDAISKDAIEALQSRLERYGLPNTELIVRQASGAETFDNHTLEGLLRTNTQIIEEKNEQIARLEAQLQRTGGRPLAAAEVVREMKALWSGVREATLTQGQKTTPSAAEQGSAVLVCLVAYDGALPEGEQQRMERWLAERTQIAQVRLIVE